MKFYLFSSHDVYSEAARQFLSVLEGYISDDQSVLILLSGGSAVRLYAYLIDWIKEHPTGSFQGKLAMGQVDERFFGGNREKKNNINAEVIRETGLWDICSEKGIDCHLISQSGTMEESSSEHNQTISGLWKTASKKIAVLGIGGDGHVAGLLPGYQNSWDVDRFVIGYKNDGPFPQRISLTPKALRFLDYALVMAAGETKRPALEQLSSGKETGLNRFPVGILRDMNSVEVITDQSGFI